MSGEAAGGPAPESGAPEAPDRGPTAERPELHVVVLSHLDTQWRWTVRDTIERFLPATLRENFALCERLPAYVLNFEGAFRYMLIQEYYPEEFERLRALARAGRWHPAGSMLDAPDVNVVSPESLFRHLLYGSRYFERELGSASRDVFLPDCFGFSHALPSVAAHCGLIGFSSSKLIKWMPPAEAPFDVGLWQGPDGAGVVAVLRPGGYGEGVTEDLSRSEEWRRRLGRLEREAGVAAGYLYAGVGDRGGALDPSSVRRLERSLESRGPIRVRVSASDRFFRELAPEQVRRLPRHRGELLLPEHGTGCYTSQAVMKRWNRKNELLADAAERAAVAAEVLAGVPYPGVAIEGAWTRFLWHQMHDDITGTSIPEAYEISWNDELAAMNLFSSVLADSVGAVARALDTRAEGIPLVVFNPLSIARLDLVEARLRLPRPAPAGLVAVDPSGRGTACQVTPLSGGLSRVLFAAELPATAFSVFDLRPAEGPADAPPELLVSDSVLENRFYRAELDAEGAVARLYDKRLGRELLSTPARLLLLRDRSARWPAWEMRYEDLCRPGRPFAGPARARVVERGPVRIALEIERRDAGSTLVQRLHLAAGEAGDLLELDTRIDWATRGHMLKAAFPLAVEDATATYDLGLGVIERGVNSPTRHEVPAQQWADLGAGDGSRGVSVLNDCRYGWDRPEDSTLRLTLVRSPRTGRRFPHQATQDFGRHRLLYALYGHAGSWREGGTVERAARLNQPPLAFTTSSHPGELGRSVSLLSTDRSDVAVKALKKAEQGDEVVVRLQETRGASRARVAVRAAAPIEAARELDGVERPAGGGHGEGAFRVESGALVASVGAFQPRTFGLRLGPSERRPRSAAWRPVDLPFDLAAASFHHHPETGDFDGAGRCYPGELLPASLAGGGIELLLGPRRAGEANALVCRGQTLDLPQGDWDALFLLASACGGDATGSFFLGGRPAELRIQDWSAPIGAWRRGGWRRLRPRPSPLSRLGWATRPRPGYARRAPIAWLGTHRHGPGARDEPYVFCYLFRYRLELPRGARTFELPDRPSIRLFAATAARGAAAGAAEAAYPPEPSTRPESRRPRRGKSPEVPR